ncbi:hypothetical protein QWM81_04475 [Streptomyces ficellus]|uniref:Lipoprotein n=1 Tax=Streptomyces ficellus TaxID=1977088 RepID=A0ABT7Z1F6_9ACTN|nr:hypothetical protein [Streptomyces ficellus]MDN3293316.1 hypothetical protein [Streptomyces ficellus]
MMRRRLAGVALLLAVTGCSGAHLPRQDGTAAASGAPAARPTTAAERSLLYRAEQELQRACMTAAGFRFWAVPENPLPQARDFPYVVDDERWAQRYGYGSVFQPQIQRLRRQDPNQVYLRGLPEQRRRAAVAALNGTGGREGLRARLPGGVVVGHSTDGCRVTAWRTLYGDVPGWYAASTLVGNLSGIRRQRVVADAEFTSTVPAWSACMRTHGFAYDDPADARAAFLGQDSGRQRAREIRTAVQEARCAHSSGLAAVARRLDRHHDRELRREHHAAVERAERLRAAALPRARAVVAG